MKEDFIFTVQQLIDALQKLPPHASIHVWDDGERYVIRNIDDWDDDHVDLNLFFIPQPDV
jgi:hypothetical protein